MSMDPMGPELQTGDHLQSSSSVYLVLEFVGEGVFAKVARCTNLETEDTVVVKILKDSYDIDRAQTEASMLEAISHLNPDSVNIIKFLERFEHNGQTCLAFESLDKSLFHVLQEEDWNALYLNDIRPIAKQLFVALDALKGLGIVHADLKLDNIIYVNRQDQPLRVKVIDFGEAIFASDAQSEFELQPIGYRAPEIVLGLPFTEAIDMWGVGCILATLYVGDNIFPIDSEGQMMHSMLDVLGEPPNHLLCAGKYTENYFTTEVTDDGPRWRRKASPYKATDWRLDDLVDYYDKESDAEAEDTVTFMDLLTRMLHLDGEQRISPHQALQHPFITISHLANHPDNRAYVTTARAKMICSVEESADPVDTSVALEHDQELLDRFRVRGSPSERLCVNSSNDEGPAVRLTDRVTPPEQTDTASASSSGPKHRMERMRRFLHQIKAIFCCCLRPTEED